MKARICQVNRMLGVAYGRVVCGPVVDYLRGYLCGLRRLAPSGASPRGLTLGITKTWLFSLSDAGERGYADAAAGREPTP